MTVEELTPDSPAIQSLEVLLWRLKARRRELAHALAAALGPIDEPLPPSSMAPLAAIETAIQAIRAEIALAELHDGRGGQVAGCPVDIGRAGTVIAPAE